MNLDLSNRTAIVCGSNQGIGLAAAIELAKMNANIVMVARNKERLESAAAQLANSGSRKATAFWSLILRSQTSSSP